MTAAAIGAGALYWVVWVVSFLFGPTPSGVLASASMAGAIVTTIGLWLAARMVGCRTRFSFIAPMIFWMASSFVPERLVPRYHTMPPFCLVYQVPLALCLAGVLWAARLPRGR
jgi:hypothetical protein